MRLAYGSICLAAMLSLSTAIAAPIPYGGAVYTQDFNGLPTNAASPNSITIAGRGPHDIESQLGSTGMTGWTMSNDRGTATVTEFRAQNGSLAGGDGRGVVSFGTDGSGDRALGTLATSNQVNRFHLTFTNTTGLTLNSASLSFTGEQWRRGDAELPGNTLAYDYAIDAANFDADLGFTPIGSFTSPNTSTAVGTTEIALDGNSPANQVPIALQLDNLNWGTGSALTIRWTGLNVSGQDDGLAIDNLSFSANVPEPTSIALFALAVSGMIGWRARNRRES